MMLKYLTIYLALLAGSATAEVTVFAAASLKEPLDALTADSDIVVSYGGSGTLARQVMQGAPADIIILAHVDWMDILIDGGHVAPDRVADFATNWLVLVGPKDIGDVPLTEDGIRAAINGGRIATGMTEAVPAGIYAKAALENLGLWEAFENDLAEFDNVRSALAQVIRGQAPLGIVYETDSRSSDDVRTVAVFPEGSFPPIRYVAALVSDSPEAADYFDRLTGPEGEQIFARFGFLPPVEPPQ
ncbi:molybdate ABC transporter substrate-binding protein [Yoonia sp. 2307UL14-13]|uniref:molybdate ABC transporter substrate-binding protein n=1 Tax=Yoonia sp. 2307UL14-13 TaxID=3126506 RepID=UPI0030AF8594